MCVHFLYAHDGQRGMHVALYMLDNHGILKRFAFFDMF